MTSSPQNNAPKINKKAIITLLSGSIALAVSSLSFAESVFVEEVQALESDAPLYISDELASQNPSYITEYVESEEVVPEATPAIYSSTESSSDDGFVPIFVESATYPEPSSEQPAYDAEGSLPVEAMTADGVVEEYNAPAGYFAQIGAFSSLSNAMGLQSKQSNPTIVVSSETNGKTLYKVQVGPFESASQAFEITSDSGEKLIYPHR